MGREDGGSWRFTKTTSSDGVSGFGQSDSYGWHDKAAGDSRFSGGTLQRSTYPALTDAAKVFPHTAIEQTTGHFNAPHPQNGSLEFSFGSNMADTGSQDKKQKRKQMRIAKVSNLRTAHDRLQASREQVDSGKEMLQAEYEDLDLRLGEVCDSQQELMNVFKDSLDRGSLANDFQDLNNMWETSRRDVATFQARLSRIRQLQDLMVNPQAQLIVADGEFLDEAEKIMSCLPTEKEGTSPAIKSSLVDKLSSRRKDAKMFKERLDDLDFNHDEELEQREFLHERGDSPAISETRFKGRYESEKRSITASLDQANADIEELVQTCLRRGHNGIVSTSQDNGNIRYRDSDGPTMESSPLSTGGLPATQSSDLDEEWELASQLSSSPRPTLGIDAWIEQLKVQDENAPSQRPENVDFGGSKDHLAADYDNYG